MTMVLNGTREVVRCPVLCPSAVRMDMLFDLHAGSF